MRWASSRKWAINVSYSRKFLNKNPSVSLFLPPEPIVFCLSHQFPFLMSLIIPSASVLLPWAWKLPELPFRSHLHRPYRHFISRSFSNGAKRFLSPLLRREIPRLRCSESTESSSDESASEKKLEIKQWEFLQSWDVPWDWKVTLYVMLPYLLSIVFAGIAGTTGFTRALQPDFQNLQPHLQNPDEVSMRLFVDQLLKTVAKLSILYVLVSPYQPFPDDVFSYRWSQPFNFQRGWIVWSGGGLIIASSAVFLVKALISGSSAGQMQNEAESLVRLFPLFGQSNASTVFLLGILGVLAPVCEETIYRGFLMTSLTKWLPMPASVVVSSTVFTLAHQSPGKFLEIFIFGMVLGLVYAKTRNLLTPITMHACWNLGVVLTLTFLQVQGYEIQKYIL